MPINFPTHRVNLSSTHLLLLLGALALASACSSRDALVTSGSPLPAATSPDDPFAGLTDRTGVAGYEFGVCNDDRDCEPTGCGGGVCAPITETATLCTNDFVAACLGAVDADLCGCVDGYCRWARTAPVLYCSAAGDEQPSTLPYPGAGPNELYPIRVTD